jgi:cytochrome c553
MSDPSSSRRRARLSAAGLVFGLAAIASAGPASAAGITDLEAGDAGRGAYLASIMVCADCHSGRLADGRIDPAAFMAGGAAGFEVPGLGIFYPPNLTADPATGLGDWSAADIALAVREGIRPDGRMLAPIMPWEFYAVLTDADMADLAAYLRSLPPVVHAVPAPVGVDEVATAPYFAVLVPAAMP